MDRWWRQLEGLADKYRALVMLCTERDALEARGVLQLAGADRDARHARTRALAKRFPGALRELDGATVAGVTARLQAIEEELGLRRPRAAAPRWMRIVDELHTELRELLHLKGARGRGEILTPEETARIADPPYGRLQELVWTRLAARHCIGTDELKRIVYGGGE